MSKHKKLALFVAPVLIIFGYISSDFYLENKASEDKLYQLVAFGNCDILAESCILKSGEFEVNIFDREGITTVNTTFPLDSATLFFVNANDNSEAFPLGMSESPYYWHSATPLRNKIQVKGSTQKLRLIAKIKGGHYISEFLSETLE